MAKFIEVHDWREPLGGESILVNVDSVHKIVGKTKARIKMQGGDFECRESYEQIRKMIAVATGGITMPPMEGKHDPAGV